MVDNAERDISYHKQIAWRLLNESLSSTTRYISEVINTEWVICYEDLEERGRESNRLVILNHQIHSAITLVVNGDFNRPLNYRLHRHCSLTVIEFFYEFFLPRQDVHIASYIKESSIFNVTKRDERVISIIRQLLDAG